MKRMILMIVAMLTFAGGAAALAGSTPVFASAKDEVCGGIAAASGDGGGGCSGGTQKINDTAKNVVNVLSAIVGIIAVIMLVVGGFRYVTSGGDSGKVAGAKDTIIYAIVGIVIVALAQSIVYFVLERVT